MNTRTMPPEAEVLNIRGSYVTITCPYCTRVHEHVIHGDGRQWYAPKCGLYLNPDERGAGYTFHTGPPEREVLTPPPADPVVPRATVELDGLRGDPRRTARVQLTGDPVTATVTLHVNQKKWDWVCDQHLDRGADRCDHIRATNKALKREARNEWSNQDD